jgi:PAS domain S-box-containing protein
MIDITARKKAEQELLKNTRQISDYSEKITDILDTITDGFIAVDKELNVTLWNKVVERLTGMPAGIAIGKNISQLPLHFFETQVYQRYIDAIKYHTPVKYEYYVQDLNLWFETSAYPFAEELFIYFRDITERKKQDNLLALEKQVLEINAASSASLKLTVDYFLEGLEKIFPGMYCSVLTLDEDGETMRHLSAPNISKSFLQQIDGVKIGPAVGSCGTAMYEKDMVIVSNIPEDPLWEKYRDLAASENMRACWSFPIKNAHREVIATIATYFKYPAAPTSLQLEFFERVSNLLRVIIENKKAEARIRMSNERYLLATRATNDAIWDWDFLSDTLLRGDGYFNLFGYRTGTISKPLREWGICIHPDDREAVVSNIQRFIGEGRNQLWEAEYRFKKADGQYALVYDRGFLIYNQDGQICRMVGSMQDITEKKQLEKQILKQELDKHKIVAQAIVDAQEKERAEIGKELHDNVNQILSTAKLYLELAKSDDKERINLIKRSTENIYNAINEIRAISRSLVPPSISDLGVIVSINDLIEDVRATKKLHAEFYYSENIEEIVNEKQQLMIFRIIQEQVNNVLKHSGASNLIIELMIDGSLIDLTISDNGKGFVNDNITSKKGVGLSNITSRTELFNGKVNLITSPGKGCMLNIHIPITNA